MQCSPYYALSWCMGSERRYRSGMYQPVAFLSESSQCNVSWCEPLSHGFVAIACHVALSGCFQEVIVMCFRDVSMRGYRCSNLVRGVLLLQCFAALQQLASCYLVFYCNASCRDAFCCDASCCNAFSCNALLQCFLLHCFLLRRSCGATFCSSTFYGELGMLYPNIVYCDYVVVLSIGGTNFVVLPPLLIAL